MIKLHYEHHEIDLCITYLNNIEFYKHNYHFDRNYCRKTRILHLSELSRAGDKEIYWYLFTTQIS